MSAWEDVSGEEPTGPFDVPAVDGIVYAEDALSPELRMNQSGFVLPPEPKHRPAPVKPTARSVAVWQPGEEVDPARFRRGPRRPSVLKGVLLGFVPVLVFVGLLLFVMDLYGLR